MRERHMRDLAELSDRLVALHAKAENLLREFGDVADELRDVRDDINYLYTNVNEERYHERT